MQHLVTDIQRFCLSDGPGIRTVVFFKGCNLRCAWCHNPETLSFDPDLMHYPAKCIGCGKCFSACPVGAHKVVNGTHTVDRALCIKCGRCADLCYADALVMSGKEMTVEEIMAEVRQDKPYYEASGGGVTLSGGEVLCHLPFALQLVRACREEGISVAIETNLSLPYADIKPLLDAVDIVMADFKLYDEQMHRKYTGASRQNVLDNLCAICDKPLIVRTPLIPGVTATEENLRPIAEMLAKKENLVYYQLLNFNPLGGSKYESLNAKNCFREARPFTNEEMQAFGSMLSDISVKIKVGE